MSVKNNMKMRLLTIISEISVIAAVAGSVIFSVMSAAYNKNIYTWGEITEGKMSSAVLAVMTFSEEKNEEEVKDLYSILVRNMDGDKELFVDDDGNAIVSIGGDEYINFSFKDASSEESETGTGLSAFSYYFDSNGDLLFSSVDMTESCIMKIRINGSESVYSYTVDEE